MTAAAQVLQLVQAHFRRDETAFMSAATALARAAKVPMIRNGILETLRKGYEHRDPNGTRGGNMKPSPLPTGASEFLLALPVVGFADLLLEPELQLFLDEIVTELEYREELEARKLRARSRLLFHGPPGNGKTSSAAALANALGVSAFGVSIPTIVSMYLGGTGKNLGDLFNSLGQSTCVVFDELDAIGAKRGAVDQACGKEVNSTVNALLTLLDRHRHGILIATTNRLDIIDPALIRRFDEVVEFPAPSLPQMLSLAGRLTDEFGVQKVDIRECRNFDEVTKTVMREARRQVMREILKTNDAEEETDSEGASELN